jgi:hypothetical protein
MSAEHRLMEAMAAFVKETSMKVYGFTVIKLVDPGVNALEIPEVRTRVFHNKQKWEQALEALDLGEDEEVETFETHVEG